VTNNAALHGWGKEIRKTPDKQEDNLKGKIKRRRDVVCEGTSKSFAYRIGNRHQQERKSRETQVTQNPEKRAERQTPPNAQGVHKHWARGHEKE